LRQATRSTRGGPLRGVEVIAAMRRTARTVLRAAGRRAHSAAQHEAAAGAQARPVSIALSLPLLRCKRGGGSAAPQICNGMQNMLARMLVHLALFTAAPAAPAGRPARGAGGGGGAGQPANAGPDRAAGRAGGCVGRCAAHRRRHALAAPPDRRTDAGAEGALAHGEPRRRARGRGAGRTGRRAAREAAAPAGAPPRGWHSCNTASCSPLCVARLCTTPRHGRPPAAASGLQACCPAL